MRARTTYIKHKHKTLPLQNILLKSYNFTHEDYIRNTNFMYTNGFPKEEGTNVPFLPKQWKGIRR